MMTIDTPESGVAMTEMRRYPFNQMNVGDSILIDDFRVAQSARVSAINFMVCNTWFSAESVQEVVSRCALLRTKSVWMWLPHRRRLLPLPASDCPSILSSSLMPGLRARCAPQFKKWRSRDIECGFPGNLLPPRPLILDFTMTHDRHDRSNAYNNVMLTHRIRSTGAPQSNGTLNTSTQVKNRHYKRLFGEGNLINF